MRFKKTNHIIFTLSFVIVSILFISTFTSAITGKIGNGKMILNVEVGDTIDRSIRVINDNDVALKITISASGDLQSDVEIIDNDFTLQPGEEKNARFKIPVKNTGKTETRINVQFVPIDGGNGVGLASQIIINAVGENELPEENDEYTSEISENEGLFTGNSIINSDSKIKPSYIILGISSIVLLVLLLILVYFSKKIIKKRGNGGDSKRIKKEVEEK